MSDKLVVAKVSIKNYDFDRNLRVLVSISEKRAVESHKLVKGNTILEEALFSDGELNIEEGRRAESVRSMGKDAANLFNEIMAEIKKLMPSEDSDYHDDDSQYASWHNDPGLFGTH